MFILGAFTAALFGTLAPGSEVSGRIEIKRYDQFGNVRNITEGSYSTSGNKNGYYIKAIIPHQYNDAGIIVISDYNSIYQSQVVYADRDISPDQLPSTPKFAYAVFENGAIPNGYESFSVAQALGLAHVLLNNSALAVRDRVLEKAFIPRIITRRAREDRVAGIRTSVEIENGQNHLPNTICVNFEAEDQVPNDEKFQNRKLGIVKIAYDKDGSMLRIALELYSTLNMGLVSIATLSVDEKIEAKSEFLHNIAFDDNIPSSVRDYRFSLKEPLSYMLRPGDIVPFANEDNHTYKKILAMANEMAAATSLTEKRKQQVRAVVLAAVTLCLGAAIWRLSKRKQKHHEQ